MINIVQPDHEILTYLKTIRDAPKALERAGRTCYKSEDCITDESAEKFVRMICRRNHESVLEHESISVRITCSRACSHQLVRHRLAAYSQESQRYVNYRRRGFEFIVPPSFLSPGVYGRNPQSPTQWLHYPATGVPLPVEELRRQDWLVALEAAIEGYHHASETSKPEDARYLLPNATKTEVVTTMNLRMWRHVIRERALNPAAQWEIRGIFQGIFHEFRNLLPSVFGDLTEVHS